MNLLIQSRKGLVMGIAGCLSILGVVVGFLDAGGATNPQLPFGAVFQELPPALTSDGGTQLSQLTTNQISTVTVSPAEALSAAESFIGISAGSTVTEATSLGAFTDSGFKQKSSSGQYQLVASNLPCYVVTFSGLSLPVAMGSGVVSHDSVIVNAATGVVIEGIKFY